jgi:hypothetical protein
LTASISTNLSLSWNAPPGAVQSYVVYDTAAHDTPAQYASRAHARAAARQPGDRSRIVRSRYGLFFRVVTVDAAGQHRLTQEQTLTVPARLTGLK